MFAGNVYVGNIEGQVFVKILVGGEVMGILPSSTISAYISAGNIHLRGTTGSVDACVIFGDVSLVSSTIHADDCINLRSKLGKC